MLAVALLAGGMAIARGLGKLAVVTVLATSALAALAGTHAEQQAWTSAIPCLLIQVAAAALPVGVLSVLLWRARRRDASVHAPTSDWVPGALGAAGALAGQAGLMVHCHVGSLSHELLIHTGGIALSAVLALAGARLLPHSVLSR